MMIDLTAVTVTVTVIAFVMVGVDVGLVVREWPDDGITRSVRNGDVQIWMLARRSGCGWSGMQLG